MTPNPTIHRPCAKGRARPVIWNVSCRMNVAEHLASAPGIWRPALPAPAAEIAALVGDAPLRLPKGYLELLAVTNGGEGDLGVKPGWLAIWPASEVMQNNAGYQVADNTPGLLGFGSNGGGELLAFDARGSEPWPVAMVPFIPMQIDEAIQIAPEFDKFLEAIGVPENDR